MESHLSGLVFWLGFYSLFIQDCGVILKLERFSHLFGLLGWTLLLDLGTYHWCFHRELVCNGKKATWKRVIWYPKVGSGLNAIQSVSRPWTSSFSKNR